MESIALEYSTLAIDCHQIASMLRSKTAKSLLLIDEFGKGTDICDGSSLFAAVITELDSSCEFTPRILATTHFLDLLEYGILKQTDSIRFFHMEVLQGH